MISSTVEDYLRQIHLAQAPGKDAYVSMKQLARVMKVAPGTATAMAKTLQKSGLVLYVLRKGVRLTPAGQDRALSILRRHRLIELFLVKVLDQDWADVHEDAHILEHAVSQRVEEAMDRVLGHPAVDPHGDPIPGGAARDVGTLTLAEAPSGKAVRITRIGDQRSEFLRYAARTGLVPGATVTRVASDRAAGIGRVLIGKQELTLGLSALETIQVVPPPTVRERAAKRTNPRTRPKD